MTPSPNVFLLAAAGAVLGGFAAADLARGAWTWRRFVAGRPVPAGRLADWLGGPKLVAGAAACGAGLLAGRGPGALLVAGAGLVLVLSVLLGLAPGLLRHKPWRVLRGLRLPLGLVAAVAALGALLAELLGGGA